MKIKGGFVASVAIVLLSRLAHKANSLSVPSFAELRDRLTNRSNTSDSKIAKFFKSVMPDNELGRSPDDKSRGSKGGPRPGFKDYLDKLADPLSRDFPPTFRRNYAYFMLLFAFLVAYGIVGYHRNKRLAKRWSSAAVPVLEDSFAYVERDPDVLDVKGWSQFEMYASGRTSCRGMLIHLDLVKRQCFWHENVLRFFNPEKDSVTFDVFFETLDHFIFGVCRKVRNKAFVNQYPHLLMFTSLYDGKELPKEFRAYLDCTDRSVAQLAAHLLHLLHPFLSYLDSLYMSDVLSSDYLLVTKPHLTCTFNLTKDFKEFDKLTRAVVNVVDHAKNFSLSSRAREAVSKERSELELAYNKQNKNYKDEESEEDQPITSEKAKKHEEKMARKSKPLSNIRIKKVK